MICLDKFPQDHPMPNNACVEVGNQGAREVVNKSDAWDAGQFSSISRGVASSFSLLPSRVHAPPTRKSMSSRWHYAFNLFAIELALKLALGFPILNG